MRALVVEFSRPRPTSRRARDATTVDGETDIAGLYDLGANSFISKPVTFDSLVNVMKILGNYWFQIVELPVCK